MFVNMLYNIDMASVLMLNTTELAVPTLTQSFASILAEVFREEFRAVHLSGQLLRSIKVEADGNGNYRVEIPPQIYDIAKFRKSGVIVPTSQNSYALKVNVTGGFSGTHKNYVEKAIMTAFVRWQIANGLNPGKLKMDITNWG